MKKIFYVISIATAVLSMASCASADKMAKQADQVSVACATNPLVVKGGIVTADVTVEYPAKYFNKNAILEVTPVVVYADKEEALSPIRYQGENVQNNYKVVSSDGSTVKESIIFAYKDGMAKSVLELRGRCTVDGGKKWVDLPSKKVADGCNTTELLLCTKGEYALKDHNYQAVIDASVEGQVMYVINSDVVRNSELKGKNIKAFQQALKEIADNDRKTLNGIDVVAYASPDGPEKKNIKLSEARSKSANKAFGKVVKGQKAASVKSVGEDWEGFKEMVGKSDIADKDLIIRVLSMYQDSNVREKEIRNMASVFQELAQDILPQLRRARFIANAEYKNYTDAELVDMVANNIESLDETALLKAATLAGTAEAKAAIYKVAINNYKSAKAQYNLSCVKLDAKDAESAADCLASCDAKDADVINAKGVCAMRAGKWVEAKEAFSASNTPSAQKNLGICAIREGKYAEAAAKLGDKGFDAALANLLNGDAKKALNCLGDCQNPYCNYLKAICYARQGMVTAAKEALKKACADNAELAERAKTDVEFATIK